MIRILFIDDDPMAQNNLKMILIGKYLVSSAYTGQSGIETVQRTEQDVILLDIDLPDKDGLTVLKEIVALPAPPPVIMLTVSGDIPTIVQAIKTGAYDYIVKPYELPHLEAAIWRAAQNSELRKSYLPVHPEIDKIVGESPVMKAVKKLTHKYAVNDTPVLILGESGTGKELVARAIHRVSLRHKGPFIPLNCAAIQDTIVESELFGSEKGAFTGAVNKPGLFEQADNGTLFLDEIGEMSLSAQAKLLRVLETNEIMHVGGSQFIKLNIRIIAATNKNLKEEVNNKTFRNDLFYRLNVLEIKLPPLREREDDIPLLSAYFIKSISGNKKKISPEAVEKLKMHTWPGNVREFNNVLQRAVIVSDGDVIKQENIIFH
ncbi:MAG: sigma-54-dependent Fis family transcriptional regulator [Spirochaetales bacterium]|nr:sigma-54-dependent Fis family transcriptional regulator [Spirochaetales bacterium]